ncbi:MAG: carbohydrate kinase family protein [Dehalococcoidia bacterium]
MRGQRVDSGQGSDLAVLGDLVVDLVVPIERLPLLPANHGWAEGIFVEPGGAGNVVVAAQRLGLATATLAAIGGDRYGAEALAMLELEGVDVSQVVIHPERQTVICIVLADRLGQHVYLGIKDDRGHWPFPRRWHETIRRARALYTDGYTLRDLLAPDDVLAACDTARRANVPVFFDPGPSVEFIPRPVLERVIASIDVLLLTEEEATYLNGTRDRARLARSLRELGCPTVVLKLGGAGCMVATANEVIHAPGFPVEVVDTVGAGDSFAAAFIAAWRHGGTLRQCATLANAMGAITATQRGAGTRMPTRERLLRLLVDEPDVLALAGAPTRQ